MSAWMITDAHADYIASAYLDLIDPAADPQAIGRELLTENARSLAARYGDNSNFVQADAYRFRRWDTICNPLAVQALACADYQCREHEGWAASETRARFDALEARLEHFVALFNAGASIFDDLPWGIGEEDREAADAARHEHRHDRTIVALRLANPMRPHDREAAPVDGLALFDAHRSPALL